MNHLAQTERRLLYEALEALGSQTRGAVKLLRRPRGPFDPRFDVQVELELHSRVGARRRVLVDVLQHRNDEAVLYRLGRPANVLHKYGLCLSITHHRCRPLVPMFRVEEDGSPKPTGASEEGRA